MTHYNRDVLERMARYHARRVLLKRSMEASKQFTSVWLIDASMFDNESLKAFDAFLYGDIVRQLNPDDTLDTAIVGHCVLVRLGSPIRRVI